MHVLDRGEVLFEEVCSTFEQSLGLIRELFEFFNIIQITEVISAPWEVLEVVQDRKAELVHLVPLRDVQEVKELFNCLIWSEVFILLIDEVDHGLESLFGCLFDDDCPAAFFEVEAWPKESFSEEDAVSRQNQLVGFQRHDFCPVNNLKRYIGRDFWIFVQETFYAAWFRRKKSYLPCLSKMSQMGNSEMCQI